MNRYDLVIYGASGFTGQYVVEFVYRAAKEHGMQSQGERGRGPGDIGLFITSVLNYVVLFVGLTNLGSLLNMNCFGH